MVLYPNKLPESERVCFGICKDGMVVDFTHIKEVVKGQLDHKNLNDVLPCNPTAENIARWICEQVPHCVKVEVCESEGNRVIYEKD